MYSFIFLFVFNLLIAELNFHYPSYSAYLISPHAFFLILIDYNNCFKLYREVLDFKSTCCVFLITELSGKSLILKLTNCKIKIQQSNFNLKKDRVQKEKMQVKYKFK